MSTQEAVLTRARGGDEEAFRALTDPYRRELQIHCYRILGSLQDAEDAVQETLLSAWRGLGGFEERAKLLPFDPAVISETPYDPTDYQRTLFVADSFEQMADRVCEFLTRI